MDDELAILNRPQGTQTPSVWQACPICHVVKLPNWARSAQSEHILSHQNDDRSRPWLSDPRREAIALALQIDWYIPGYREGAPPKWCHRQADVVIGALEGLVSSSDSDLALQRLKAQNEQLMRLLDEADNDGDLPPSLHLHIQAVLTEQAQATQSA